MLLCWPLALLIYTLMLVMQQPGVFLFVTRPHFQKHLETLIQPFVNTDITEAVCTEGQSRKIYSLVAVAATIKKETKGVPSNLSLVIERNIIFLSSEIHNEAVFANLPTHSKALCIRKN